MEQRIVDAQQLMRDAGYYPEGFTITVNVMSSPAMINSLTVQCDIWKKHLNINYEMRQLERIPFSQALSSGEFDVTMYQLASVSTGDPNDVRGRLTTGSPTNFLGYSDPAVDILWQQQGAEFDMTKRIELCQQIERAIMSEYMLIPYAAAVNRRAWWPYVKGFTPTNAYTGLIVETVWLDR
jgi:peptide/nickel transport system substrate-binding protein